MKVKHFRVRVSGEHLQNDQAAINQFLNEVTIQKTATHFISGMIDYWSVLLFYEPKLEKPKDKPDSEPASVWHYDELSQEEKNRLQTLKVWRTEKASQLGLPQYMICHNAELMTLAKIRPHSIEELKQIKGFGQNKVSRYGDDLLSLLQAC